MATEVVVEPVTNIPQWLEGISRSTPQLAAFITALIAAIALMGKFLRFIWRLIRGAFIPRNELEQRFEEQKECFQKTVKAAVREELTGHTEQEEKEFREIHEAIMETAKSQKLQAIQMAQLRTQVDLLLQGRIHFHGRRGDAFKDEN